MTREGWRRLWREAGTRAEWQKTFGPLPWWYAPLAKLERWVRAKQKDTP